jgi:hypothetical protein
MTQEEKRIKLAEAGGWKGILPQYKIGYAPWRPVTYEKCVQKTPIDDLAGIPLDPLPDYFACLNAVHELEMKLDNEYPLHSREFFRKQLRKICHPHIHEVHATAAQRAEALGRTLSLWTE